MARFDGPILKRRLEALSRRGVYVGTSSWKYLGWQGALYSTDRYTYRGRFSETRFNRGCLEEYGDVFPTVCVDAAYYKFPEVRYLEGLASQVPASFRFGFKVTDTITIKKFPNLPRFGDRAGQANPDFLAAPRFVDAFLAPFESIRDRVGLFIFEFSRFYPSDFARGRDFVMALDGFLGALPRGWPYGVEIRNRQFLRAEYFTCLRQHNVAHIYNSWQHMPSLEEQMALEGSLTTSELTGARLLLRPGRAYEAAVREFEPYDRVKDRYPEGRAAAAQLIRQRLQASTPARTFVFVNNRFEGSALETIADVVEQVTAES